LRQGPVVALLMLLCACAPPDEPKAGAGAAATTTSATPAADEHAYRERVIASTADMGLKGPPTARAAYAALDGKASVQQILDLGGEEEVKRLVRKCESRYENRLLRRCLAKHFGSEHFSPAYVGALAASPDLEALVADAQRLAPAEYDAQLAGNSVQTTEDRARAAVTALLTHVPAAGEPGVETLTMVATSHMAKATGGACVESPKFLALLAQAPH
jgi:hypothetical protein